MSSIGSLHGGSSTSSIQQLLSRLSGQNGQRPQFPGSGSGQVPSEVSAAFNGVDPQQLQGKVQSAVSDAVKDFDPSGSTEDLFKTIQSTVDKTLKDNGVDVDKLKSLANQNGSQGGFPGFGAGGPPPGVGGAGGAGGFPSFGQSGSDSSLDSTSFNQQLIDALTGKSSDSDNDNDGSTSTSNNDYLTSFFKQFPPGSFVDQNA